MNASRIIDIYGQLCEFHKEMAINFVRTVQLSVSFVLFFLVSLPLSVLYLVGFKNLAHSIQDPLVRIYEYFFDFIAVIAVFVFPFITIPLVLFLCYTFILVPIYGPFDQSHLVITGVFIVSLFIVYKTVDALVSPSTKSSS